MDNNWFKQYLNELENSNEEINQKNKEVLELASSLIRDENLSIKTSADKLIKLTRFISGIEKNEENKDLLSELNKLAKKYEKKREREVSENFGKYLRSVRQDKGLTLAEAARLTNVSASYLNRLELAQRNSPSITIIERLAMGLDIPFYELAQKSGIDLGERREKGIDILSIAQLVRNNKVSLNNMGPALSSNKKESLIDIINFISNSPWGENPKEEIEMLTDLVCNFRS